MRNIFIPVQVAVRLVDSKSPSGPDAFRLPCNAPQQSLPSRWTSAFIIYRANGGNEVRHIHVGDVARLYRLGVNAFLMAYLPRFEVCGLTMPIYNGRIRSAAVEAKPLE